MRYTIPLLLLITAACGQSRQVDSLKKEKEKDSIQRQVIANKNNFIVLVKISGEDSLRKVMDKKWPENIETIFNILLNQKGQIIYSAEFPTSESGDWNLAIKHYFNAQGKSIAFKKVFTYFSNCSPGTATSKLTQLYDINFNVLITTQTLTDNNGKKLDKKECSNEMDVGIETIATISDLIKLKKIRL